MGKEVENQGNRDHSVGTHMPKRDPGYCGGTEQLGWPTRLIQPTQKAARLISNVTHGSTEFNKKENRPKSFPRDWLWTLGKGVLY